MFAGEKKELTDRYGFQKRDLSACTIQKIRELPESICDKARVWSGVKNCVVLGGASGAGAEYVRVYAARKYRIAFMDMDKQAGKDLKERLEREYGGRIFFFHGDAYSEEDMDIFLKAVRQQFGRTNSFFYNLWNWPYLSMMGYLLAKKATVACIYRRPDQTNEKQGGID